MNAVRCFGLLLGFALLSTRVALADDRYDQEEYRRYRAIMDKIIDPDGTSSIVPPLPPAPRYIYYYAAIAYSPSSGDCGYSYGSVTQSAARRYALAKCAADDAQIVGLVRNGSCALAVGKNGAYAVGMGATLEQAKAAATQECLKRSSECHIERWVSAGGQTQGYSALPPTLSRR